MYTNSDLWTKLEELITALHPTQVQAIWIPSHTSPDEITAGNISQQDHIGNHIADQLSNKAADACQYPDTVVQPIRQHIATAILIQRRLAHFTYHNAPRTKTRKGESVPRTTKLATLLSNTRHDLRQSVAKWRCQECGFSASSTTLCRAMRTKPTCRKHYDRTKLTHGHKTDHPVWVKPQASILVGQRVLHPSHYLTYYRGICIFLTCGHNANQKTVK